MGIPPGWSSQKLAEFVATVSSFATETSAALGAVERVAESLNAEVAAIVSPGMLVAAIGYPEGEAPVAELDSVARGDRLELTVPGAGLFPATVVPLEHPPDASLVVARSGPEALTREEAGLLQGMARVTSMTLRMRRLLDDERAHQLDLERLANEQAALRRVATLVARGVPAEEVFNAVAEEVGRLVSIDSTLILRYEADGTATVIAGWTETDNDIPVGARWTLEGDNVTALVLRTERPARIESYANATGSIAANIRETGARSAAGAPIVVDARLWGVMAAGSTQSEPLPVGLESRLAEFTELVATAISNAQSRADLAASRARVVATADETRRRIERDLHDGTQQRLVSIGLGLRTAEAMVPSELVELKAQLSRTAMDLAGAVEDLLEVTRSIHPPALSAGGLGPALRTLARRSAVPVEVDVRADRLPERVEVAAYYVVSEALMNAVKHAKASVVHVDVERMDGLVRLSIRDDGVGGADPGQGSGLIGLGDRVEALGGKIQITSPPGSGTSVLVTLPIEPR